MVELWLKVSCLPVLFFHFFELRKHLQHALTNKYNLMDTHWCNWTLYAKLTDVDILHLIHICMLHKCFLMSYWYFYTIVFWYPPIKLCKWSLWEKKNKKKLQTCAAAAETWTPWILNQQTSANISPGKAHCGKWIKKKIRSRWVSWTM